MSWLLLLLLVPLITIPVVLLLGFAGCGSFSSSPVTDEPENFNATAAGVDKIKLNWTHPSAGTAKFDLSRADDAVAYSSIKSDHDATTFDDQGLADGRAFHYQLVAKVGGSNSSAVKTSGITKPKAPFDLEVTAQENTQIDLQWKNASSAKNVRYRLQSRRLPDEAAANKHPEVSEPKASATSLLEGREYEFQVVALVTDTENGALKDVESDPSSILKSSTWKLAFGSALTEFDSVRTGTTIVQRFPAASIAATGGAVRLTLRGRPITPVATVLQVWISQPSSVPGAHEWDPAPDRKQVDFGPILEIGIPSTGVRSRKTPYQVVVGKDLLIAMNVKPETPARDIQVARSTVFGVRYFEKRGVSEAALADRTGNYDQTQNQLFWIERIEVTAS